MFKTKVRNWSNSKSLGFIPHLYKLWAKKCNKRRLLLVTVLDEV